MSATTYPVPIFSSSEFELESRRESLNRFLPAHFNRRPTEEDRSHSLWAVEGLLIPGEERSRRLLAVNIGDVEISDRTAEGGTRTVFGADIAGMLVSARLGYVASAFPNLDRLDGTEARIVLPRAAVQPIYAEGFEMMNASMVSLGASASQGAEVAQVAAAG